MKIPRLLVIYRNRWLVANKEGEADRAFELAKRWLTASESARFRRKISRQRIRRLRHLQTEPQ